MTDRNAEQKKSMVGWKNETIGKVRLTRIN
jgi:hypothetical protein